MENSTAATTWAEHQINFVCFFCRRYNEPLLPCRIWVRFLTVNCPEVWPVDQYCVGMLVPSCVPLCRLVRWFGSHCFQELGLVNTLLQLQALHAVHWLKLNKWEVFEIACFPDTKNRLTNCQKTAKLLNLV